MRTPKTYRLQPSTLQIIDQLKHQPRFANSTETEIVEVALWSLYANGPEENLEAGD